MDKTEMYISSKGKRTLRRCMRDLRVVIDTNPDPAVQRIAYGMECAIRWATEKTVSWKEPAEEAQLLATMLREELSRGPQSHER